MFSLDQKAKLKSVAPSSEFHGDERQAVYYLKFKVFVASDALIDFHPQLRTTLFKESDAPDLADQGGDDTLTQLRFPQISSYNFDFESEGYSLHLDYGLGGRSVVKLDECKVDKFKFTPQNGGTVEVDFRVVCHPEVKDVGKICELIMSETEIKLIPPEPTTVQELFGEEKPKTPVAAWPFPTEGKAA